MLLSEKFEWTIQNNHIRFHMYSSFFLINFFLFSTIITYIISKYINEHFEIFQMKNFVNFFQDNMVGINFSIFEIY